MRFLKILKNKRGQILFYVLFVVIPLSLWTFFSNLDTASLFSGYRTTALTIGKLMGITGICFFSGNLLLSGRYKLVDKLFGGLDKVYLFHRQTGKNTFYLLTVHMLAMTAAYSEPTFQSAIAFIFDYTNTPIVWGKLAYTGLLIIICITLFVKIKYERLKFIHMFMGSFLILGGLHAYLIPSDIAFNMYLRWYILILVSIAILSYLIRTVFKKWLVRRLRAQVTAVNVLLGSVTEVIMKPENNKKVLFHPGQFIFVKFKQAGFPFEDHPFSLTASPEEGQLRISAKAIGDFTKQLPNLKPGAQALIQGPYGSFSYDFINNKDQVWIAGGIGVTPFMSMARTLRDRKHSDLKVTFYYSVQEEKDFTFKQELSEISQIMPNIKLINWNTKQQGFLSITEISKNISLPDKDIFICGPAGMMKAFTKQLSDMGIPKDQIHFELFRLL